MFWYRLAPAKFLPSANEVLGQGNVLFLQVSVCPRGVSVQGGRLCLGGFCPGEEVSVLGGFCHGDPHLIRLLVGGTQPTGMHSCDTCLSVFLFMEGCLPHCMLGYTPGRHILDPLRYYGIRSTSGRYASYWNANIFSSVGAIGSPKPITVMAVRTVQYERFNSIQH